MLAVVVLYTYAGPADRSAPFGMVLQSIREQGNRARGRSVSRRRYKIVAVMLSGLFTSGLAGAALHAMQNKFARPANRFFVVSGEVVDLPT